MAYYGKRLSFGGYNNLTSVTIPDNVIVGDDGDFSGRFSRPWDSVYENTSTNYDERLNMYLDTIVNAMGSGLDKDKTYSEQIKNVSLRIIPQYSNCPHVTNINIGGGGTRSIY